MLFRIQLPLMLFLQGIETSALDLISSFITFFGESPLPLLLTIFIYWCLDKKKGFVIASSLMSAMMSMQILKAIFRIPRPFMEYPDLIKGKRQSTATGYSFPSGHSTTAAAFYGSLAYSFRNKAVRAICIILIVLVPISRLYLGVHWPLDILAGALIGLICSLALAKAFEHIYEDERRFIIFTFTFALISLLISLTTAIAMDAAITGYESIALFRESSFYRATHNLMQNGAIASGLFLGMLLDRKYLSFVPATGIRNRILSMIVGIAAGGILAIALLAMPILKYTFEFIAYAFVGIWATYIFPLIAARIGLMDRR